MRYIVTQRFRRKAICGPVNLPFGTVCDTEGDFIILDGQPLCTRTSQNAYDFFSRDDDGKGAERGRLVQEIRRRLERRDKDHQRRWDRMWADEGANRLRRKEHGDFWIWGFDFYNADVAELRRIKGLLEG